MWKPVISNEIRTSTSFANLDGVTGRVVPPKDEKELAKALKTLLESDVFRKKLGEQAKQRVEKEFDVRIMAVRTYEAYREVV